MAEGQQQLVVSSRLVVKLKKWLNFITISRQLLTEEMAICLQVTAAVIDNKTCLQPQLLTEQITIAATHFNRLKKSQQLQFSWSNWLKKWQYPVILIDWRNDSNCSLAEKIDWRNDSGHSF